MIVKTIYSLFRFLFELLCIGIIGYWGFQRIGLGNWRYVLAILAPLALIAVWGMWMAPSSSHRLQGITRLVVELGVYAITAVCLYFTDFREFTVWFIVLALVNAAINHFTGWLI